MKGLSQYTSNPQERFSIENPIVAPLEAIKVFADVNMTASPPRFFAPRNRAERRAFASAKWKRK